MKPQVFRNIRLAPYSEKKPEQSMACDTNSKFVYTGGADVQKTWKRYGWTPPSEYRNDYLFKKNREANNE